MCASSRIPSSVPHDFAWRMALVAMPRSVRDELLQGR